MNSTYATVSKPLPSFIKQSSNGSSSKMSQSLAGSSTTEGMFLVLNELHNYLFVPQNGKETSICLAQLVY